MTDPLRGLRFHDPDAPDAPPAVISELLLMDRPGIAARIALTTDADAEGGPGSASTAGGTADGWAVELRVRPEPDLAAAWSVELRVRWGGAEPIERGLRLALRPGGGGDPTWLIPGCFQGENRPARCARRFPRYDPLGGDPAEMVSSAWSFRADRAAVPFVMTWTGLRSAALALPDGDPPDGAGFGFSASGPQVAPPTPRPATTAAMPAAAPATQAGTALREGPLPGDPHVWLDLPAREEPITFDGGGDARAPTIRLLTWAPGQRRSCRLLVTLGGPERDAYAPVLRAMERWGARGWSPAPWVDATGAATLAADGLLRWHLRRDPAILIETATFDRDLAGRPIVGEDRPNMHVGWLSGTPCAGPLLAWGRRTGDAGAIDAATAVLDHIATGVSPSGLLWGEWRADRGWSGGWNPSPGWIHLRTAGEATLFLGRALVAEASHGATHPTWEDAWRAGLDAAVRAADAADGRFGTYVDGASGAVMERDGTGGLVWIPALLEGADRAAGMGRDDLATAWRAAARRAGEGYAGDIEAERLVGAPEDIHLAPSSEDGYGALMAYTALAEREPDPDARAAWLDLAQRAATWTMTFRLTHDTRWPEPSILARYGFRSRGADIASPSNQHLHAYGLVCVPEQLRLARLLDDPWLARRARDHVLAWRQLLCRADGDLNGRRGMLTERVYHTDCFAPKGAFLPLSHAWCLGLVLGAALHELEHPEDHVDARP